MPALTELDAHRVATALREYPPQRRLRRVRVVIGPCGPGHPDVPVRAEHGKKCVDAREQVRPRQDPLELTTDSRLPGARRSVQDDYLPGTRWHSWPRHFYQRIQRSSLGKRQGKWIEPATPAARSLSPSPTRHRSTSAACHSARPCALAHAAVSSSNARPSRRAGGPVRSRRR